MNKMKFGAYIKESRLKKHYTQQELADLLFVDVSAVSKWERGVSYPDITLVPDICRVLEISEHELIESSHDVEYRKIKKDAIKYNNMKKGTFLSLNIGYIIAILTCFIVNVAVNHTLSWFFIVLTSIMCAYSFCPTITWLFQKHKKLVFIGSTFISMFLLFLTCSIYASNYWFMIATVGVLLTYFIVLYPLLFHKQKNYLNEEKYNKLFKWFLLSYLLGMFVITILLLVTIYLYTPFNIMLALLITGGIFVIPIILGILNLFEIGKTMTKPILLSLAGVFVILIILMFINSLYLKNTMISKTYTIEESYNNIEITGDDLDINIYLSDTNENKIVYIENKKVNIVSKVKDGVLLISQKDSRKFYDKLFNFTHFKVNLYLSQQSLDSLNIECDTGDITIEKGFNLNNVKLTNSTGDIDINSNIINNLNIKNSTGDVEIENTSIGGVAIETSTGDIELVNVECNKLDIKVSTGDTELDNVKVSEDFNMNGSTGDLDFEGFDAKNIYITLTTGNVKGTILSSKIFNVKSNTGRVNVPETYTGGICKIIVSTGNVTISYK